MRRTITVLLLAAAIMVATGCSIKWLGDKRNLQQTGDLVRSTASTSMVLAHQQWPDEGDWETHVCSTATVVLAALDGDATAVATVNQMLAEAQPAALLVGGEQMTIEMRKLLLGLLAHIAVQYDLEGWGAVIASAIDFADTYLQAEVTTDYEVWYLIRQLFTGIVEGCELINGGE
ncbi:MAG: hypothetical protein JRI80_00225 [Deltaproteobacteria bacterium]|nr:hypothetical protein [Deltaproteobacteria bacterium]